MEKKFGVLSSSTNPEQLANTVKGVIVALSGGIILVANYFGISLLQAEISMFASQVGIAVGALWTIFGLLQKVVVRATKKN